MTIPYSFNWERDTADFISSESSHDTRNAYLSDLNIFRRWLDQNKKASFSGLFQNSPWIREFVNYQILNYSNFKTKNAGISKSTVARRLATIRSFCQWIIETYELGIGNPVKKISYYLGRNWVPKSLPRPIPPQIVRKFLKSITNMRDRVLFKIYYDTGARLSEIINLDEDDIKVVRSPDGKDFYGEVIVKGKGNKERVIFLTKENVLDLMEYIKSKPYNSKKALFVTRYGGRMTRIGVEKQFSSWHRKSGLRHFTIHQFRHSFATNCLKNGMRIEILKEFLGHSWIRTTLNYAKVEQGKTRKSFFKIKKQEEKRHARRRKKST